MRVGDLVERNAFELRCGDIIRGGGKRLLLVLSVQKSRKRYFFADAIVLDSIDGMIKNVPIGSSYWVLFYRLDEV